MKPLLRRSFLSLFVLTPVLLVGCDDKKKESDKAKDEDVRFVACTKTDFDTEVTVGSHKYKLAFDLAKDKSLLFKGTCTGKVKNQGGGMGPGGPGGFNANTQNANTTSQEEETDFTKYDFTVSGSWILEDKQGYVLTLKDSQNSVLHTDYIKIQGRHQFYYNVTTDEGSAVALFQSKDSAFGKTLPSDYKTWDERDSDYIFEGATTGNNNSVATAYLYAHKNGSVVFNTAKDSDRKVTLDLKWKKDGSNFVLIDNGKETVAENSIDSSKPGYRLSYSSITFFCSTSSSVTNDQMTNENFDGKTLYQFKGSYTTSGPDGGEKQVSLNLTDHENGMYLYNGNTLSKKGTYTKEGDKFVLTFEGEEPTEVIKNEEGKFVYAFQITVKSFFGTSTIDVTLTYTPEA